MDFVEGCCLCSRHHLHTGFVVLVWIVNLKEEIHFKGQFADASNCMYALHSLVSKQLVISALVMLVGHYRQNICTILYSKQEV